MGGGSRRGLGGGGMGVPVGRRGLGGPIWGGHEQRIIGSRMPLCHRHMVVATTHSTLSYLAAL